MSKKQIKKKKRQSSPRIHCEDCGELLDRTSTFYLVTVREQTNMPNLPAFCSNCRLRIKNKLKGYWHGLKGGVKPRNNRPDSDS
jgi:hypothetical protein